MQISGLNPSAQFGADDVLAIEINGVTYKLTGAVLADALRTIGDYAVLTDGVLPIENGGTGANSAQGARTALGNAAYTIFNNYPQSAVTSNSATDVNIVSTSVALPAGTYLVIAFAYVHQSAGSGRLKFKYGGTSIESVVSDGAAGETVGINAVTMGIIISDGTAQTVSLSINSGSNSNTMTALAYMQYKAVVIRI
jgi:hypothetical protein